MAKIAGDLIVTTDVYLSRHLTVGNGTRVGVTRISQIAHGFSVGDVVRGDSVDGYALARADSEANAAAVGMVTQNVDANTFELSMSGLISQGVPLGASGTVFYLSATVAGALTATAPAIKVPVLAVENSGTTGHLAPMAPSGSSGISDWVASTDYVKGATVNVSGLILRAPADFTSEATFDTVEAAKWTYIAENSTSAWTASTLYVKGQQVYQEGVLYERLLAGVSGALWNTTEQAGWQALTGSAISAWAGSSTYQQGDLVTQSGWILRRSAPTGVSAASFTLAEAASWEIIAQVAAPVWAATNVYVQGAEVTQEGVIYAANATFTSSGVWDAAEKASWRALTATSVPSWAAVTPYKAGVLVQNNGVLLVASADIAASQATFNATEAALWTYFGQASVQAWTAATVYPAGVQVIYEDAIWERAVAGLSLATFTLDMIAGVWSKKTMRLTAWATATPYAIGDVVAAVGHLYRSTTNHTSGAFDAAAVAANWSLVSLGGVQAYTAGYHPAGSLVLQGGEILRRSADGDAAAWSLAEAANWIHVSQSSMDAYVGGTIYPAGFLVTHGGSLYQRTALGTSAAVWDATEAALWTKIAEDGALLPWAANTLYAAGDVVVGPTGALLRALAPFTSGATYDLAEAAKWVFHAQGDVPAFSAATVYKAGEQIIVSGVLLSRTADGLSGASFDSGEASLWTYRSQQARILWAANTTYVAGTKVNAGSVLVTAPTTFTSEASFDAVEVAKWGTAQGQLQYKNFFAGGSFIEGTQIVFNGVIWQRVAAGTDGATFNTGNWARVGTLDILDWSADTFYSSGEMLLVGQDIYERPIAGISESTFGLVEVGNLKLLSQGAVNAWAQSTTYPAGYKVTQYGAVMRYAVNTVSNATYDVAEAAKQTVVSQNVPGSWVANTVYPAGYRVNISGQTWRRTAAGTSAATLGADISAWTLDASDTRSTVLNAFPDTIDGVSWVTDPTGFEIVPKLSDADAAAATVYTFSLGNLNTQTGDTGQIRLEFPEDLVNLHHVYAFKLVDDSGTNAATELVDVGTGGLAVVVGGPADGGNVTMSATVEAFDRGGTRMVRLDLVHAWSGVSGANPRLEIQPAYNLDGTAVKDVTSTGDLTLLSLEVKSVAEFAVGQQEVAQVRLDSSAATVTETLEAGTGANQAVLYTNSDVQANPAILKVQAGETLNGVLNGEFRFSNYANGSQFIVTSDDAGSWNVSVMGAPGTMSRVEVPVAATEVTLISGVTTLVYNATPAPGQIAAADGYYYDEGSTRHFILPFSSNEDDVTLLEISSAVLPSGSSIETMYAWTDNLDGGVTSEKWNYGLVDGATNQFFFNRIDSGSDRRNWTIHFSVKNAVEGQVVLAGMVEPRSMGQLETLADDGVTVAYDNFEVRSNSADQQFQIRYNDGASGTKVISSARAIYVKNDGGGGNSAARNTTLTSAWTTIWTDNTLASSIQGDTEELHFSADGVNYFVKAVVGPSYNDNRITIIRKDQGTVVSPDVLTVEDQEVTLLLQSGVSDGTSVTLGDTWPNIVAAYEKVRVSIIDSNLSRSVAEAYTADLTLGTTAIGGSLGNSSSFNLSTNATTATSTLTTGGAATSIRVTGIKAQKTVVNTADVAVTDSPSTGYRDIGDTREYYGTGTVGTPVVFPASFATATPNIQLTTLSNFDRFISVDTRSATGFTAVSINIQTSAASTGESFMWKAIGTKP